MALKEYGNNSTGGQWVTLGGFSKKTGKPNPTVAEGYYLGVMTGPNTFEPGKTKTTVVLKTSKGNVNVNASTNLVIKLKDAEQAYKHENGTTPAGAFTVITYTGEAPSKKGTPLKLFSVQFDNEDVISLEEGEEVTTQDEFGTFEEEDTAQNIALKVAERKAKVQALLNKNTARK